MDGSLSRVSALIVGTIAVGSLLAGCAATTPGAAVIGTPTRATPSGAVATGDLLAGLQAAITSELNAVNSSQTDNATPQLLIELNALNSPSSLVRAEQFSSLQATGVTQVAKRERAVEAMITAVRSNNYLGDSRLAGLRQSVLGVLSTAESRLQALSAGIAGATLTDVLRSDILSIGPSTRVYGLLQPIVHLSIAGGEELDVVATLTTRQAALASQVAAGAATDPNYSAESARMRDLAVQLSTARRAAEAAVNAVLGLTPAGFPGNKATIVASRATLTALRSPLGTLSSALGDVNEIVTLLALRAS